jgi:hypothetical protein
MPTHSSRWCDPKLVVWFGDSSKTTPQERDAIRAEWSGAPDAVYAADFADLVRLQSFFRAVRVLTI